MTEYFSFFYAFRCKFRKNLQFSFVVLLLITIKCSMFFFPFHFELVCWFLFHFEPTLMDLIERIYKMFVHTTHNNVRFYCQWLAKAKEKQKLNLRKVLMAIRCDFMMPIFSSFFYCIAMMSYKQIKCGV